MRSSIALALSDLRNTMRGSEESWVNDPASSFWRQSNKLLLNANCFLTQVHSFHRLRWLLKDAGNETTLEGFSRFMQELSRFGGNAGRNDLMALLEKMRGDTASIAGPSKELELLLAHFESLPTAVRDLALAAAEDLKQSFSDIPDETLPEDWRYLCAEMEADLRVPPQKALDNLKYVMDLIRKSDNVRAFMIANSNNQKILRPAIEGIVERLSKTPSVKQTYRGEAVINSRLRERYPTLDKPVFVGLINDNTRMGVFVNSAPCASFEDSDPATLRRFLSARLYGGGGAHSMFMKTWSAGLAYSNGLRSNEFTGRLIYYAERCPNLAQTMQFVTNELRNAPRDPALSEYAVAQAFAVYRSGSRYEDRGEAMANDLADGLTPLKVRKFRQAILELRKDPHLYDKLYAIMEDTYGRVLPGYGPKADSVKDAVYFIIGPESQFKSYEDYLHSVEGPYILYRIYPRDYWIVRPSTESGDKPQ